MSYVIEYNRKIYIDRSEDGSEFNYLLLIKQGDNNVYDPTTRLRDRSWELLTYGWEYQLWDVIGRRGGATEGGSLQRGVGWNGTKWWTIEEYVALYREKIKKARSIEKILDDFNITAVIRIVDKKKPKSRDDKGGYSYNEYEMEKTREIMKKYLFKNDGYEYYYPQIKIMKRKVESLDELRYYLENLPKGRYGSGLWSELWFQEKAR